MAIRTVFVVGDVVELRDAVVDDHVKVEWNTGEGYVGKTTMLAVRALRKRPAD